MQKSLLTLLYFDLLLIICKHTSTNLSLLIILIPFLVGFIYLKPTWSEWLLILSMTCFLGAWCYFYPSQLSIKHLNQILQTQTNFYHFQTILIHYVQTAIPDQQIANFVTYLMFNYVDPSFVEFKTTIQAMGISHLFVVSGLHINLILGLWDKCSQKWSPYWLTCSVRIILCAWFCYCLSFSVSTLRVLIQSLLKCKRQGSSKANLGYACLLHGFLFNDQPQRIGFLFSYGCTLIAILVFQSQLRYQFVKTYLTNVLCYLFTLPILINLNHQINCLSILFNLALSPFLVIVFGCIMLLMIFPYGCYVFYFALQGFLFLIQWLNSLNLIIHLQTLPKLLISCYYFLISNLFMVRIFKQGWRKNLPSKHTKLKP